MKYYLKDILPRLKKHSASLDQSAFLVDKPWVVSNSGEKFEKLIFKRDGTLYLSSNGDVTEGKWDYLAEAQSLLIDYGDKKKLYRHQYLDEAVLALKIDGPDKSDENYYLLANENIVEDYNAKKYLHEKYVFLKSFSSNISSSEVAMIKDESSFNIKSDEFKIIEKAANLQYLERNGKRVEDGRYIVDNKSTLIIVKNGTIHRKLNPYKYKNGVKIWQRISVPTEGDIIINNRSKEMSIFKEDGTKYTIKIDNEGMIVNVKEFLAFHSTFIIVILIIFAILFVFISMN